MGGRLHYINLTQNPPTTDLQHDSKDLPDSCSLGFKLWQLAEMHAKTDIREKNQTYNKDSTISLQITFTHHAQNCKHKHNCSLWSSAVRL
jgi:hypothetical protein